HIAVDWRGIGVARSGIAVSRGRVAGVGIGVALLIAVRHVGAACEAGDQEQGRGGCLNAHLATPDIQGWEARRPPALSGSTQQVVRLLRENHVACGIPRVCHNWRPRQGTPRLRLPTGELSLLSLRFYLWIFLGFLAALILLAVGGNLLAAAGWQPALDPLRLPLQVLFFGLLLGLVFSSIPLMVKFVLGAQGKAGRGEM